MLKTVNEIMFYTLIIKSKPFEGKILGIDVLEDEKNIIRGNYTENGFKYCTIRLKPDQYKILKDDKSIKDFVENQIRYGIIIKESDLMY